MTIDMEKNEKLENAMTRLAKRLVLALTEAGKADVAPLPRSLSPSTRISLKELQAQLNTYLGPEQTE